MTALSKAKFIDAGNSKSSSGNIVGNTAPVERKRMQQ
jgi:hypothetical protein